eukprot:jgi/Mesen1/2159/ME000152S01247
MDASSKAFRAFFTVCGLIAQGRNPLGAAHLLASSRLVAMAKGDAGVCPINVREVLYRLPARAIASQLCDPFEAHFAPDQFGVALQGGCEAIAAFIQTSREVDPSLWVLQVDVANAFNTIDRGADPFGGTLFALGHLRALRLTRQAFLAIHVPSYANDTPLSLIMALSELLGPFDPSQSWAAQAVYPCFMGGVGLEDLAFTSSAAFLGSWGLIAHLLATRFAADNVQILAAAIREVETETFSFQAALVEAKSSLTKGRRVDIVCMARESAARTLLDVVVANPLEGGIVELASSTVAAAAIKEKAKTLNYSDTPVGDTFVPLALEVFGTLGTKFHGFLNLCAERTVSLSFSVSSDDAGYRDLVNAIKREYPKLVGCSLQRAQASTVHKRAASALSRTLHRPQFLSFHFPLPTP